MFRLPEIFPADPCAPESIRHRRKPLRYGIAARCIPGMSSN